MVYAKGVYGVENTLRPGVACRSTARMNMRAVTWDVQGVGNCSQTQNTYRNILHRNLNKGELKRIKIFIFR